MRGRKSEGCTLEAQKDLDKLIDKSVSFVLYVWRLSWKYQYQPSDIIPMDETPVWSGMVSDTTADTTDTNTACYL